VISQLHDGQARDSQAARGLDLAPGRRETWQEFHDELRSFGGPPLPLVRARMLREGAGELLMCRIIAVTAMMWVAACSFQSTPPEPSFPKAASPADVTQPVRERAAAIAKTMLGTPYTYGGASPAGFDCSGLAHYAYRRAGVVIPRQSTAQRRGSRRVDVKDVAAGDLLFFDTDWKRNHVGISLGGAAFVHAPSSGKRVSLASLDNGYFRDRLIRVGRFGR